MSLCCVIGGHDPSEGGVNDHAEKDDGPNMIDVEQSQDQPRQAVNS